MTIQDIIRQARALSPEQRKELIKYLIDILELEAQPQRPQRRLSELRGLGRELWENTDPQTYLDELRSEWNDAHAR